MVVSRRPRAQVPSRVGRRPKRSASPVSGSPPNDTNRDTASPTPSTVPESPASSAKVAPWCRWPKVRATSPSAAAAPNCPNPAANASRATPTTGGCTPAVEAERALPPAHRCGRRSHRSAVCLRPLRTVAHRAAPARACRLWHHPPPAGPGRPLSANRAGPLLTEPGTALVGVRPLGPGGRVGARHPARCHVLGPRPARPVATLVACGRVGKPQPAAIPVKPGRLEPGLVGGPALSRACPGARFGTARTGKRRSRAGGWARSASAGGHQETGPAALTAAGGASPPGGCPEHERHQQHADHHG